MKGLRCNFCGIVLIGTIFFESCPVCHQGICLEDEDDEPHIPEWQGQRYFWRGSLSGITSTVTADFDVSTVSSKAGVDKYLLDQISREVQKNIEGKEEWK